jgi:hypothetical protein
MGDILNMYVFDVGVAEVKAIAKVGRDIGLVFPSAICEGATHHSAQGIQS